MLSLSWESRRGCLQLHPLAQSEMSSIRLSLSSKIIQVLDFSNLVKVWLMLRIGLGKIYRMEVSIRTSRLPQRAAFDSELLSIIMESSLGLLCLD